MGGEDDVAVKGDRGMRERGIQAEMKGCLCTLRLQFQSLSQAQGFFVAIQYKGFVCVFFFLGYHNGHYYFVWRRFNAGVFWYIIK